MDINIFNDPNQVPQPRDQIKIEALDAEAYPDRFRVFIKIQVTAFQERPNLLLVLRDREGQIVDELSVIATMHADMEFTRHLRGLDDPAGDYSVEAELFYDTRNPPQDRRTTNFTIPEA